MTTCDGPSASCDNGDDSGSDGYDGHYEVDDDGHVDDDVDDDDGGEYGAETCQSVVVGDLANAGAARATPVCTAAWWG